MLVRPISGQSADRRPQVFPQFCSTHTHTHTHAHAHTHKLLKKSSHSSTQHNLGEGEVWQHTGTHSSVVSVTMATMALHLSAFMCEAKRTVISEHNCLCQHRATHTQRSACVRVCVCARVCVSVIKLYWYTQTSRHKCWKAFSSQTAATVCSICAAPQPRFVSVLQADWSHRWTRLEHYVLKRTLCWQLAW